MPVGRQAFLLVIVSILYILLYYTESAVFIVDFDYEWLSCVKKFLLVILGRDPRLFKFPVWRPRVKSSEIVLKFQKWEHFYMKGRMKFPKSWGPHSQVIMFTDSLKMKTKSTFRGYSADYRQRNSKNFSTDYRHYALALQLHIILNN